MLPASTVAVSSRAGASHGDPAGLGAGSAGAPKSPETEAVEAVPGRLASQVGLAQHGGRSNNEYSESTRYSRTSRKALIRTVQCQEGASPHVTLRAT